MELVLPKGLTSSNFVRTLVHPSLSSTSDFLGYVQPRPTAPFPYSNAWGNNLALYLPFFVLAWFGRDAGWRRKVGPFVLVGGRLPHHLLAQPRTVDLARAGGRRTPPSGSPSTAGPGPSRRWSPPLLVGGLVFVSSPLYDTLAAARGDAAQQRPPGRHGRDRRLGHALDGSPVVGYGTTRKMQGSFSSLAGGETEECHQCAAPPLGTQGFMWRLVLTTGLRRHLAVPVVLRAAVPPAGPGAGRRSTWRRARSCSSRCSASSSTTRSARRCSRLFIAIGLMARADLLSTPRR